MRGEVLIPLCYLSIGAAITFLVMSGGPPGVSADCVEYPCEAPPCCNGDVNGSGDIDIADAVYLLTYLFAAGPQPTAVSCPPCDSCCLPCPSDGLPATGQVLCYNDARPPDGSGNVVDCGSGEFPGQDGCYRTGCSADGRFVDNGDGTVTDTCTGLMWQQETPRATHNWQRALRYCEDLPLGGYDDWRLPNIRELQSIVDYGRTMPSIDPAFVAMPLRYWSSSTVAFSPDEAWYAHFNNGYVNGNTKNTGLYVRAVRG